MKANTETTKLSLRRESLRELTVPELLQVAAGTSRINPHTGQVA